MQVKFTNILFRLIEELVSDTYIIMEQVNNSTSLFLIHKVTFP